MKLSIFKNIFLLFLLILIFSSCSSLGYRLSGYKELSFEWGPGINEVYFNNRRIVENEIYFVNDALHIVEWIEDGVEKKSKIYFNKSGRYYIGDGKLYFFRKNIEVVDEN